MNDLARSGAILGFVAGLGLVLVWVRLPWRRRHTLAGGAIGIVATPVVRDLARAVERVMGGADSVRRRQLRAGMPADLDRFRAEQVLWGVLGAVIGALAGVTSVVLRDAGWSQLSC